MKKKTMKKTMYLCILTVMLVFVALYIVGVVNGTIGKRSCFQDRSTATAAEKQTYEEPFFSHAEEYLQKEISPESGDSRLYGRRMEMKMWSRLYYLKKYSSHAVKAGIESSAIDKTVADASHRLLMMLMLFDVSPFDIPRVISKYEEASLKAGAEESVALEEIRGVLVHLLLNLPGDSSLFDAETVCSLYEKYRDSESPEGPEDAEGAEQPEIDEMLAKSYLMISDGYLKRATGEIRHYHDWRDSSADMRITS